MTIINPAVLAHRVDYWTWVENHAVPDMRDVLLRMRDHWRGTDDRPDSGSRLVPARVERRFTRSGR